MSDSTRTGRLAQVGVCVTAALLLSWLPLMTAPLVRASGRQPLLWLDETGRPSSAAAVALSLLQHAGDDALDPADYDTDRLNQLASDLALADPATTERATFEAALNAAMLAYLHDLHFGRIDPRDVAFRLPPRPDRHDLPNMLRRAVNEGTLSALATELRPQLAQYRLLRAMLPRYRTLALDPTLQAPPPFRATIRPGDRYEAAASLRHELAALGDLPGNASDERLADRYDGAVVDGVKRFQVRHGLLPDGVLGPQTVAALRVPLSWRVRQIELALERLRWLPDIGPGRLLVLNIPMFRLWAWDHLQPNGVPLFGMDVIVGRALDAQTPVLQGELGEITFRPYWNVPFSITKREVLPALARDPDYLTRQDMEIVRGMGDDAPTAAPTPEALAGLADGTLRVRQRPGPNNALGLIKFEMPNEDDVYLHGTPAQALFSKSRRDFSHGCVRVADPLALATWALAPQPAWTRETIAAAMSGSGTVRVPLDRPIQVLLFYTTAAVMPEDGTIRFAEDIYHHDARLDRVLRAATRTH